MKKNIELLAVFLLASSSLLVADNLQNRFEYKKPTSKKYASAPLNLKAYSFEESSVEDYNSGVEYNNQAIKDMEAGDFKKAAEGFHQACILSPSTIGFRKNYVNALNRSKVNPQTIIDESLVVLGMDPDEHKIAYNIGVTYLNDLKDNLKAADYFSYALKKDPNNLEYVMALASALENTGEYDDTVFELYKNNVERVTNDPYPFYRLALKYQDRNDFDLATSYMEKAKSLDKEKGYAHHAYVRSCFYAGRLNGLEAVAKNALSKFYSEQNAENTRRVLNSISDGYFYLTEKVVLNLKGASALKSLNFCIRPIIDFSSHQEASIISMIISSKGKTAYIEANKQSDGTLEIDVPKEFWSPEIRLDIKYRVSTKTLCGVYYSEGITPNISEYKDDEKFSLNDGRLARLVNIIDAQPFLLENRNYNSEEKFVLKASLAVARGLNYKENGTDMSVSWALDNPNSCDCSEFSRLLAAVCLKKGIPARLVNGFLVKSEFINRETSTGHEWCEVYIEGKGWKPIDPTLLSTMNLAYFGNQLSDQIFFEYSGNYDDTRVGVRYKSTASNTVADIKSAYLVERIN